MSNPSGNPEFMERHELRERLNRGEKLALIDVRSAEELAAGHIDGAMNIPASELAARIGEIPRNAAIVRSATSAARDLVEPPNNSKGLATAALCRFEVACAAGKTIRDEIAK